MKSINGTNSSSLNTGQSRRLTCWLTALLISLACLTPAQLLAETDPAQTKNPGVTKTETTPEPRAVDPKTLEQLKSLVQGIEQLKQQMARLDSQIAKTRDETTLKTLKDQYQQQEKSLAEQRYHLEQLATGAVDLSLFDDKEQEQFSWKKELQEIFQPVIYELKVLSERPRQLERLRSKLSTLKTRIAATDAAISEIQRLQAAADSAQTKKALKNLLEEWQTRQQQYQSELQLTEFQLQEKDNQDAGKASVIVASLKSFVTGRGLNLILAFVSFALTFTIMRYLGHFLEQRIARGQNKDDRLFARLVHIILQVLAVILAIFASLASLYALGDWLLIALFCVVLVGLAFALRNSLPKYIGQVRLLLNLGPVREGERVIYNGLPWKVSRLNIYSDLINPALTGGRLRLPLNVLGDLVSRRWSRDEPWFPCKPEDYVILSDSTAGAVKLQSPESVQLEVFGGGTKLYNTLEFLALTPHNISAGFAAVSHFGLDYGLQDDITEMIPSKIETFVKEAIASREYGPYLTGLLVEFSDAGSSSLNLILVSTFSGEAASHYFKIRRFLQRATVDACNKHGWPIPFNQVTVHLQNETMPGTSDFQRPEVTNNT